MGELSRLNRESGGELLRDVPERQIYRGALTVMMRLVFLFYAEEHRLLPVDSDLYAGSYSVTTLAEEIVKYTLEPLCYAPGPADGVAPAKEHARPADELLDLKVLNPARGSAAFLVSACRFLAERVVEAWDRDAIRTRC